VIALKGKKKVVLREQSLPLIHKYCQTLILRLEVLMERLQVLMEQLYALRKREEIPFWHLMEGVWGTWEEARAMGCVCERQREKVSGSKEITVLLQMGEWSGT